MPTPSQTSVIQTPVTATPTQTKATAVVLDGFTKTLLIVIIVLAVGLVITVLLLKNAKKT